MSEPLHPYHYPGPWERTPGGLWTRGLADTLELVDTFDVHPGPFSIDVFDLGQPETVRVEPRAVDAFRYASRLAKRMRYMRSMGVEITDKKGLAL